MSELEQENCVKCGIEITENAIIYIRHQVNNKWGSYPCCTKCWYKDNADRLPVRMSIPQESEGRAK